MNTEGMQNEMEKSEENARARSSRLSDQVSEAVHRGKDRLEAMQHLVTDKTKECVETTSRYIHERPWQAMGLAAGAGLLLGLWISRR